jgi:hypothetical protein
MQSSRASYSFRPVHFICFWRGKMQRKTTAKVLVCAGAVLLGAGASTSRAGLTHRYSFNDGTPNDSVGGLNGTLVTNTLGNPAPAVSGGMLNLNNPNFSGPSNHSNYLSLPPNILPASGSATIEQWFTFGGSGFFTEAYTFSDNANDTNGPGANNGQYLMHTISAPQPASPPGGPNTGGSHIAQALSGYAGSLTPPPGPETDAFGTTPGIGAGGGGGYLDDGGNYMAATVIDGTAGTLSYYLFRVSDGVGGLQQTITAIPLSSYSFTNAYLGRSAFAGDNATNGSVDEFRMYNDAHSAAQIAADFAAGPNQLVPEPMTLSLLGFGAAAAFGSRRSRRAGSRH